MFLEQLISLDGIYLLKWQDRKTYFDNMKLNKPPKWFNELSNSMIEHPTTSRRIKRQWRLSPQVPDFNSAIFFNHGFQFNSWTCFWSSHHNSMITGKLLKSLNQDILIEHWKFVTLSDDNSPSNKRFLIQKCQGCNVNDDRIVHPGYFPKGIRSPCAISSPKNIAIKLLNVKKYDNNTSVVGISKFHYEQLAKYHCFKRLPGSEEDIDVDHNIDDRIIHQDNGVNARLIRSIVTNNESQVALIRASWNFNNRLRMTFYTDGSLQNIGSDTIKGGAAWMETSTTTPVCFQTSISNEWISSFKTELVALLLALLVSCEHSEVHIYTDSKSVIDKFKDLARNVDTFKYARDRLKDSHSTLWFAVFVAMETLDLKVIMHKVKSHNNNLFNDQTDALAKQACSFEPPVSFNCNKRYKVAPLYKGIEIEVNLRRFLKDITSAKEIVTFLQQKRMLKYNVHRIDWMNTMNIINDDEASTSTSFKSSYVKSKKVKLLIEELPTLDFLKTTKPSIYDDSWNCPYCNNNETFLHVWTCAHHVNHLEQIILDIKSKLLECLTAVITDFNSNNLHYQYIISHGSWWTSVYEPVNITFVDLIKGIVPFELSEQINCITNNQEATTEILRNLYQKIYILTQPIWLDRCKLIVQKEQLHNISGKMKKKSNFGGNNFERSAYVDRSIYSLMPNVITSAELLIDKMVTRGCHFSNF
jgi:ribonuclease HI